MFPEADGAELLRRIDKYEILSTIGEGGMASVYRARLRGPGHASKQVALKLIHEHLSRRENFLLMFLDEMRVAMAMTHRNIVQTFDAGQVGERHYLVMELVPGCTLRWLLDRTAGRRLMPVELAVFIAMEVCSALDYAHSFLPEVPGQPAGVVHRDVSPSNILLSSHGDVKLADFGVAKAAGQLQESSANLIKGKLGYMAPEQARGRVEPRSDLFSLGAVLYEMLAGQAFRQSYGLESVRQGGETSAPLAHVRPDVPASLEALVRRCLATTPEQRPASAAALRQALADEAFRWQLDQGQRQDPHAHLRAFLAEEGASDEPAAPSQRAARLAQLMVEQAGEVASTTEPSLDDAPTITRRLEAPGASPAPAAAEPFTEPAPRPSEPFTEPAPRPPATSMPVAAGDDRSPRPPSAVETTFDVVPRYRYARWMLAALALCGLAAVGFWAFRRRVPDEGAAVSAGPGTAPEDGAARVNATTRAPLAAVRPRAPASTDAGGDPQAADAEPAPPSRAVARPSPTAPPPRAAPTPRRRESGVGRLELNAVPWAEVYVDGRHRGETPLQRLELEAGTHHVRLVNRRHAISKSFTVRIRPGATTTRVVNLR